MLVGRNMSGKSNVLDVLHFLKDAMHNNLELAVTVRQGIGAVRPWQPKGRSPYSEWVDSSRRAKGRWFRSCPDAALCHSCSMIRNGYSALARTCALTRSVWISALAESRFRRLAAVRPNVLYRFRESSSFEQVKKTLEGFPVRKALFGGS